MCLYTLNKLKHIALRGDIIKCNSFIHFIIWWLIENFVFLKAYFKYVMHFLGEFLRVKLLNVVQHLVFFPPLRWKTLGRFPEIRAKTADFSLFQCLTTTQCISETFRWLFELPRYRVNFKWLLDFYRGYLANVILDTNNKLGKIYVLFFLTSKNSNLKCFNSKFNLFQIKFPFC